MKYITLFKNHAEYTKEAEDLASPNVSLCKLERELHRKPLPDFSAVCLTFVAQEDGTFSFTGNDINYSLNNGATWSVLQNGESTPTIEEGTDIMWKATLTPSSSSEIGTFSSTGSFIVEGNVMSLIYGDDFIDEVDLTGKDNVFYGLFSGCSGMTDATNLSLPATTLTEYCYCYMFASCTSLTNAPSLPATTLADSCYESMFEYCTSLTTAPSLPATTLTYGCYQGMFYNCTSLTTAPVLPATTLAEACYYGMFNSCSSLTATPALSATTLADSCYSNMFNGCTMLTTVSELPATTLATTCYSGMFNGCTSLTTAPVLSATTLVVGCYNSMFSDCTSLNEIECLATDMSASNCTMGWVNGVAATGTFIKDYKALDWTTGSDGIPTGWEVEEETPPYEEQYLTYDIKTSGTVLWYTAGNTMYKTISYSKNYGKTWTEITSTNAGTVINVDAGDKVIFKGNNGTYATDKNNHCALGWSGGTASFNIYGNVMSLVAGDNFKDVKSFTNTYALCSIFKAAKVISAKNLILPAETLTEGCYRAMFSKAFSLVEAPAVLPATTLAQGCYWYMFEECTIEKSPDIISEAQIPASGYGSMFISCASLNYIYCMSTPSTAQSALTNWTSGVSQTGIFVKKSGTSWTVGANGIPSGWTVYSDFMLYDPVINCDGEVITITCATEGATIFYRLNETGDFSQYAGPIPISEDTVVEAYASKTPNMTKTVKETCPFVLRIRKFSGLEFSNGPLYYGNDGYEIKDSWNSDSYGTTYGENIGSTYFNYIEMGKLFEMSGFTTSDGNIENGLMPFDGWRLPTQAEWASVVGVTRNGSTVNGAPNKHFAVVELTGVTYAGSTTPNGLLLFPDDETITGSSLSDLDGTTVNTGMTEEQLDVYLEQGCAFIPACGQYDGEWNDGGEYLSSSEYDVTDGYILSFLPNISADTTESKTGFYCAARLVRDVTYGGQTPFDHSTRSIDNWKYNGANIDVPYSVNAIDGHSASYAKGNFNFTTTVPLQKEQPTQLWFQHADQSADIYVNNQPLGTHWGGYNAFTVDVSQHVTKGLNNVKVVLCNKTRNELAPASGDFNFNATLGYVNLLTSPVLPGVTYGYDGFHISSTVSSDTATISARTSIPVGADVVFRIDDDDENYHYVDKKPSTGEEMLFTTTITNPHLWNGTLDPHLYNVTLEIYKNGDLYHRFQRPYGFRYYKYVINDTTVLPSEEPYTGFLLNGSPYLLRGVCMHNDLDGKANALTRQDIANDFELIRDLGCNFIRTAHYPHPKEVYDWCDKLGIILETEVPCVNNMKSTMPSDYYTHLVGQYADMVNQHYNHPSIIFWCLSNETTTDDATFAKEKIEGYISEIKALDQERMVGYVMAGGQSDPSAYYGNPAGADWFGCNIYHGWYNNQSDNNPSSDINTRIKNIITNKGKALAYSEYGAGGTQRCHSVDYMATTTRGNNPRHDIEYQMWLHEGHIAAIKNYPQLLFTSQWQLFDIAVSSRNEGYTVCADGVNASTDDTLRRLNDKGLVERDHRTKKDTYYLYKAWWNPTPFVHICGKDYTNMTDRSIKCYSNDGDTFSLYVNDMTTPVETVTAANNIVTFTARGFSSGDVVKVVGNETNDSFTFA